MNPLLIIGGGALTLGLAAGVLILNAAITNLVGCIALNMLGYGAIVAAAGAFWPVTSAIALGLLAMMIPSFIALGALSLTLGINHPLFPFLSTVANIGVTFSAGVVGAGFLGLAANPVGLIALAGAITLNLVALAITFVGQLICSAGHSPDANPDVQYQNQEQAAAPVNVHSARFFPNAVAANENIRTSTADLFPADYSSSY